MEDLRTEIANADYHRAVLLDVVEGLENDLNDAVLRKLAEEVLVIAKAIDSRMMTLEEIMVEEDEESV